MKILERQPYENNRSYVIRVLLHNIVHLDLPPGSAVSENELAAALSVSRTPIREALIELSRRGLVEILPQRGSYITKINYKVVEESRFMRLVMEIAVLKLACQGINSQYLSALQNNLDEQRRCWNSQDSEQFLELDNAFHALIFSSVDKSWSHQIVKEHMIHFDRLRMLSSKSGQSQKSLPDHEDIFYAISRKDPELAEMVMKRHLTRHLTEKAELYQLYPDYFIE